MRQSGGGKGEETSSEKTWGRFRNEADVRLP